MEKRNQKIMSNSCDNSCYSDHDKQGRLHRILLLIYCTLSIHIIHRNQLIISFIISIYNFSMVSIVLASISFVISK